MGKQKKFIKNSKFEVSAKFELSDGSYYLSDTQDYLLRRMKHLLIINH